ncbi:ABC transporter substrate-binding protein [Aquibacillus koreensis]|uniref:ABC transporter substrate-binding protein n=1 Tax=Aquibacillus koreensis TaxID=279446 RepID=A0A9X3WMJ9_9BACI|nr:ABC transporter substrate-binding protein [Aquibacillus koreensis]MCT2536716.1 ABC transporter substrate-binding protein [Aquibacillus koreensis]MDC3421528.1 ABC transporter substrate-binding protein [Aquibacillus koreensis]
MKLKRIVILLSIVLLSMLVACSSNSSTSENDSNNNSNSGDNSNSNEEQSEDVKITFFNTSAEVNEVFENLFDKYHELNSNVTVELIPTPIGGAQIEKFQSLLASGTPATIANLDAGAILQYKDKFLDLESDREKYEQLTKPGTIDRVLLDGKFLGVPWTSQGYGLLYNKRAVEDATGESFDPASIRKRDDLATLFEKIDAAGTAPVVIHGADWSLGSHYTGLGYALQSQDVDENLAFVEDLKNGEADLSQNKQFNGLMDTFDLLKKYNLRKDDPLVSDYNLDSTAFAKGEAAFYFMGDWTWAVIGQLEGRDDEFGVIPVPISNNPEDYGNSQIAFSEPKLFAIDDTESTEAQQKAAKDLIEWMLTSEEGQMAIITDMGLNMPYENLLAESPNIISHSVDEYVNKGDVINISVMNYFQPDWWSKVGASMQKYLSNNIEREELYNEFEDYWESSK